MTFRKLKLLQKIDFNKLRKEIYYYRLFNKATCMNNKYFTNHIRCLCLYKVTLGGMK